MTTSVTIQLALEDLLADLNFARKHEQLGRLALLAYCDVKRWARQAGKADVADMVLSMFAQKPCQNKEEFLVDIDQLLGALQSHDSEYQRNNHKLSSSAEGSHSTVFQH